MIQLHHRTHIHAPVERCFDLARSVEVHLLRNFHCNASAMATAGVTSGLVGDGQRVTWRARHFYAWHDLASEITDFRPPVYFQNTMRSGPFHSLQHGRYFKTLPSGMTEMEDYLSFAAPLGILGRVVDALLLHRYMGTLLHERAEVIKQVAESDEWMKYLPSGPML